MTTVRPRARARSRGAWRITWALAVALGCLLLGVPRPLWAHGALRSSVPAKGAHLASVPKELRLTFTEAPELAVTVISLTGPDGRAVPLSPITRAGETRAAARVIVTPIQGPLAAGAYTVRWQIAGADGHPVRGTFEFVIAPGAAGAVPASAGGSAAPSAVDPRTSPAAPASDTARHDEPVAVPRTDAGAEAHHDPTALPTGPGFDAEAPVYAGVRWFTYLGLLGLIGAVAFRFVVLGLAARRGDPAADAVVPGAAERAATLGGWSALVLVAAAAARLAAQSVAMHGGVGAFDWSLISGMLTRTTWGWGWLLQAAAALTAIVGFRRARAHERTGWVVAAVAATVAAVTPGLSGHAASSPRLPALAVAADALHVVGAAGWLGSLLVLLAAGVPAALALGAPSRGRAVAALVSAFSPTALAFAGLAALTGLYAAWMHVGTLRALWETRYGVVLLTKLGVLSLVAFTGAYNWLRVRPALGDDRGTARLRRSAGVELAVTVLVLAATAVLVATPTPMDAPADAEGEPAAAAAGAAGETATAGSTLSGARVPLRAAEGPR